MFATINDNLTWDFAQKVALLSCFLMFFRCWQIPSSLGGILDRIEKLCHSTNQSLLQYKSVRDPSLSLISPRNILFPGMQAGTGKGSSGADAAGAVEAGEHGSVRIKVNITRVMVRGGVRGQVGPKIGNDFLSYCRGVERLHVSSLYRRH